MRKRCVLEKPEDIDQAEYQRKLRSFAVMLNRIVSRLVPHFGAYALVLYSALEGKSRSVNDCSIIALLMCIAFGFPWAQLARRSEKRQQEVIKLVTEKLLCIEF